MQHENLELEMCRQKVRDREVHGMALDEQAGEKEARIFGACTPPKNKS